MASQITSHTIVYSTVYSGTDQRKHQSSVSLAFVRVIHRWPMNSSLKWPVTRKIFSFDDVIILLLVIKECSLPSARLSIGHCIALVSYNCVLELLEATYLKREIHRTFFSHPLYISMIWKLEWLNHIWGLHKTFWPNLRPTFWQLGPKNLSQINMCVDAGNFFWLQITFNIEYS